MTTYDRRQVLKALASVGAASAIAPLAAACDTPSSAATRGSITIGLIVPSSGPLQRVGAQMAAGLRVYLEGTGNTLGGNHVSITTIDEGSSPETALSNIGTALGSADPLVLVGVASSTVLTKIAQTIERNEIPLLATGPSPSSLGIPSKYIWRTSFVAGEAGTAMATYISAQDSQPRIFVVDDGTADSQIEAKRFVGAILSVQTMNATFQQLSSPSISHGQINQISAFRPDLVFAACEGQAAIDFVTAYSQAGIKARLYGPGLLTEGSVSSGTVLDQEGTAALGVYTTMNYAPNLDSPQNQTFVADYFGATKPSAAPNPGTAPKPGTAPTTFAMTTYDAGTVLDTVIPLVRGELTRETLADALRVPTQFISPRGTWEFNDQATPRQRWYLRQVRYDGPVLENTAIQAVDMLN